MLDEKKTCRTCGRPATHWYVVSSGWNSEHRYGCEGHSIPHISNPADRGRYWGILGEDDDPES